MHHNEPFIVAMYDDWVQMLEVVIGIKDIAKLRSELETWFMECYHARNEVRMVPEGSNIMKHLYNRFAEKSELKKMIITKDISHIALTGVLAKIEKYQPCEWVEKAIVCVESELALIEKYTKMKLNLDEVRENEEFDKCIIAVHSIRKNLQKNTKMLLSEMKKSQDNKQSLQKRSNGDGLVLETEIKNLEAAKTAVSATDTEIGDPESWIIQLNKKVVDDFNNLYELLSNIIGKLNSKVTVWKAQFKLYFVKLAQMPILEALETRCAQTGKLVYDILHEDIPNITNIQDVSVPLTDVVDRPNSGEIKLKFTKLLEDFIQSTFLVIEQESCIIRMGNKSMPKIVLRILAADFKMPPDVKIKAMYLSEDDINQCCVNGNIDFQLMKMKDKHFGKETVKCSMIEQKQSRKFEAVFKSPMCDMKIDRTHGKAVHKEKYRIGFEMTINHQSYWTMSLPLVVNTGSNQECLGEWSVLWQCYGSDVYEVPITTREQLKWCEVADMLNRKLLYVCPSRPLSEENICHLKMRLFGSPNTKDDELVVMKKLEVRMLKADSAEQECLNFSFLEWFVGIFNLIDSHLAKYWDDGLIHGFISKEEARKKLQDCSRSGTFILRFSDTNMLKSQGYKSMFGHLTACVMVITTDVQGQKVKNFCDLTVAGNKKLTQHSLAHLLQETSDMGKPVYRYLYPGTKTREELFDKCCDNETVVNGYTESKEAFVVDLSQEFCKMQIKTGKRDCTSMASKSFRGSQEIEAAAKKKCIDEHPAIKTLLQVPPEIQSNGLASQQRCSLVFSPPASAVCVQYNTASIVQLPEEKVSGSSHSARISVASRKDSSEKTLPPSQAAWLPMHISNNTNAAATAQSYKEDQSNTGVSWNNETSCTYSTTDALPRLSPFSDNAMTVVEAASCPSESQSIANVMFDQTCSQDTPSNTGNLLLNVSECLQLLVQRTSLDYIKLLLSQYEEGQGKIRQNNCMSTNSQFEADGQANQCISVENSLETTTSPSDCHVSSEDCILSAGSASDSFDFSFWDSEAMSNGFNEFNLENVLNDL